MYDEKDNRYLDCVNNVTHGRCFLILSYFINFLGLFILVNDSTLGFIFLQKLCNIFSN